MWPRLLVQLAELLPHANRLAPAADNYSPTRIEADRAQAAELASMSGSFREEINGISATFGAMSRQLSDQKKQISDLRQALEAAETHRITQTNQLEWLTGGLSSLGVWVKFGITIVILLLGILIALTMQVFLSR